MASYKPPKWEDFHRNPILQRFCKRETTSLIGRKNSISGTLDQLEEIKYWQLKQSLDDLKTYYKDELRANTVFADLFEQMLWETYFKRLKNKRLTWNFFLVALESVLGFICSATMASIALQTLNSIIQNKLSSQTNDAIALVGTFQKGLMGIVILLLFVISARWFQKHKYRQTWVRHSQSFHALNMSLIKFLYTTARTEKDRKEFEEEVFRLLNDNLSRFSLNMEHNGRN